MAKKLLETLACAAVSASASVILLLPLGIYIANTHGPGWNVNLFLLTATIMPALTAAFVCLTEEKANPELQAG